MTRTRNGASQSLLVASIPDPRAISWASRHLGANLILALLLILLIGLPAELINSTMKEHYDRVNKPFVGARSALVALEEACSRWR